MLLLIPPTSTVVPLIVSVPHSGLEIPDLIKSGFANHETKFLNQDSDLYVDKLYESVPEFGGTLLVTSIHRYVIDVNRDSKDRDASFVDGAPVTVNPKHLGLIAHKTTHGKNLLKQPLTEAQLTDRIKAYYNPFHKALQKHIEDIKLKFGYCIHIDAHSMPSVGSKGHNDDGMKRADIVLGDLRGHSCSPKLTNLVETYFQKNWFSVKRNNPYAGGFITKNYGNPKQNVHTIQIEINRKLYMNEKTLEILPQKFDILKETIQSLLLQIRDWRPK